MPKLIGLHLEHPRNEPSYVELVTSRDLKSGKLDVVRLTRAELVKLVSQGARALEVLEDIENHS